MNIATGHVPPVALHGMPRVTTIDPDEITHANRASTQMLLAISATGKHLYQGTVPAHVKARRRAANKAARHARRAARR